LSKKDSSSWKQLTFSVEVRDTYIMFSVRSNYLKFHVLNAEKTRILLSLAAYDGA